MPGFFSLALGRDFWNFRAGQLISVLGDACGSIALAWWVLDRTGSAAEMSSILAPAMLVRIFLLPACGPVADQFPRRTLLVLSDLWRFVFSGLLFTMVCLDVYRFPLVLACYLLLSAGSALFAATLGGMVPKIVRREHLQVATQQSQALNSFGSVAGGIVGGVVVSAFGVKGAFGIDAFSFLAAAAFTSLIRADTKPAGVAGAGRGFDRWRSDFQGGFRILLRLPLLFWLCVIAMFMNLCLSPLSVVLPVLVKEARSMPPWFLGGLESSIAGGAILGAITVGSVGRYVGGRALMVGGIAMIGVGVSLLPWVPNAFLPLTVLFWVGVGSSWANVLLGTQISLTVPDSHRGRLGAIMGFLCSGIAPLGVAVAGLAMARLGLSTYLFAMGILVVALGFLILLIPRMKEFLEVEPEEAEGFFGRVYPGRRWD